MIKIGDLVKIKNTPSGPHGGDIFESWADHKGIPPECIGRLSKKDIALVLSIDKYKSDYRTDSRVWLGSQIYFNGKFGWINNNHIEKINDD